MCGVAGWGDCIQKLDNGTPETQSVPGKIPRRDQGRMALFCALAWVGGLSGGRDLGTVAVPVLVAWPLFWTCSFLGLGARNTQIRFTNETNKVGNARVQF